MKSATIQISYDATKLAAIRQYTAKRGAKIEDELTNALQKLYEKHVPAQVREYIEACAAWEKQPRPARPRPPARQNSNADEQ